MTSQYWVSLDLSSFRSSLSLHVKSKEAPPKLLSEKYSADRGGLEWTLPALETTLAENKISLAQIKHWFLPDGPGSFTGLRIGAASLKGILLAHPAPVSVISSLEARLLAYQAKTPKAKAIAAYKIGKDQFAVGSYETARWKADTCSVQELKRRGKDSVILLEAPSELFSEGASVFELKSRYLAEGFTGSQTVKTFLEPEAWTKFQPQYWGDTRFGK